MQPIGARTERGDGRGTIGAMPRPVRRLVRRFEGFLAHARPMRRGVGSGLAVGFFLAGAGYAAVASGAWSEVASRTAAGLGVPVGDIAITGQVETPPAAIYAALDLQRNPSLVGLDLERARERLLALPWISNATLRARYPGGLSVSVVERKAFAVWQKDDVLTIVEHSGRPITRYGITELLTDRFSHLPRVVGEGAAEHAAEVLPLAARHDGLAERVASYVRVGDRRWDVVFETGLRLKLPERSLSKALTRFALLEAEHELLARPLTVADLRAPGRVTLRLDEEAARARAEEVAEHLKAMKKADRPRRKRL